MEAQRINNLVKITEMGLDPKTIYLPSPMICPKAVTLGRVA